MDPKRVTLTQRIAAAYHQAALDDVSLKLQAVFRDEISGSVGGIDWSWDALGGESGRGAAGSTFSMSGRPAEFDNAGINGGILVKGEYDYKDEQILVTSLKAGFYFKTAADAGRFSHPVDLGAHVVDVSDEDDLSYSQENSSQQRDAIHRGIRGLIDGIVKEPPPEALSRSKRSIMRRNQRRMVDQIADQNVQNSLADKDMYSTIEGIIDQIDSGVFGTADLARVLRARGQRQDDQAARSALRAELESYGLKFVPSTPPQLASSPASVAESLRAVADHVDRSERPSISATAAAICLILECV